MFIENEASRAVVRCGDGCGFLIGAGTERYVVTTAHCLPYLPKPFVDESRIYRNFVDLMGKGPELAAECVFVDPVSDIAVLAAPDIFKWTYEAQTYTWLVGDSQGLPVAKDSEDSDDMQVGWLVQNGSWFSCRYCPGDAVSLPDGLCVSGPVDWFFGHYVCEFSRPIVGGMSGSPILNDRGAVIGILTNSNSAPDNKHTEGVLVPRLTYYLPGWILSELDGFGELSGGLCNHCAGMSEANDSGVTAAYGQSSGS